MKIVLSFFSILLAFISLSQNLHEKISQDAVAVFGLNGEQILQKVSLSELSSSPLYDELMKRHYSGGDLELIGGLEDFGIDYTKAIYYVEETGNEEVDFSFLCYHIKDLSVFENTVKTKMVYKEFEQNGDINIITYSYYNKLFWNSQFAILIVGETRKNNYYSSDYYDYGNYGNEETIYYEVEVAEEDPMDTLTLEDLENMTDEQWQAYLDEQEALQKQREEEEQNTLRRRKNRKRKKEK